LAALKSQLETRERQVKKLQERLDQGLQHVAALEDARTEQGKAIEQALERETVLQGE
jgi:hypothetical protein